MAVRGSSALGERELLRKYPFLPGASSLVADLGLTVAELVSDPVYDRARELGRTRILAAADDSTGANPIPDLARSTPEEGFLSFLYARLLLAASPTPAPLRRWAVAEAKRAYGIVRAAPGAELEEVGRRLDRPLEPAGRDVAISVPDYVRLATPIREGDFRLSRQAVGDGRVLVHRDRGARLLQEAVRLALTEPIELDREARASIADRERAFLDELARRMPLATRPDAPRPSVLRPAAFPPCIRKMARTLQAGENLSHAGRFALAAFLHRAGADLETIVDAYRGAPDFDESITRYQVDHITQRDSGAGYMVPDCETLRSHGLCARDGDPQGPTDADRAREPRCFDVAMTNPLKFYRPRGGPPAPDRPEAPGTPPTRG